MLKSGVILKDIGNRYGLDVEIVACVDIRIDTDGNSVEDGETVILCRMKGFSA